jgi:polar amino acid transport system permease protein
MASGSGGAPELDQHQPGDLPLPGGRPSSRILSPLRAEGAKGVAIALASTALVLALIVWAVVSSPNWPEVQRAFFDAEEFRRSFPDIARAFLRNVRYFLIAEVFILAWALVLAVLRSLKGPVFFPLRVLAIGYTDLFRGVPTVLVVYLLGFGVPSLDLPGVPSGAAFWGVVGLILSYSAYVAEVYRAGIESVHPSQAAAARSLGLSRWKALRFVIVPQAVRRVIPPLLNDFIGLQKDTALVAFVVAIPEAFKQGQIYQAADFNFTPLLGVALMFLLVTIPLTRLTDWLVERQRRRRQAGIAL